MKNNPTADWLARAAQQGAELSPGPPICADCAFRPQPDENGYGQIVEHAASALLMGGGMNCHTREYQDAGVPCRGFAYAKAFFESLDTEN